MLLHESEDEHLASEVLCRTAGSGGITDPSQYEAEHLSLYPRCLEEWASWRRAITVIEKSDETGKEESAIMTYGYLKAAATPGPEEPMSFIGECGRFTLGIFPQVDDPKKGMIDPGDIRRWSDCLRGSSSRRKGSKWSCIIKGENATGGISPKIFMSE